MEEQKKKYFLARIQKEESIIQKQYSKFRTMYQSKPIFQEKSESYLQTITHLTQLNNTFAANLLQYLEKQQIANFFEIYNAVFSDLIQKYKRIHRDWKIMEDGKNNRERRQICEICHDKLQSNRIVQLKAMLDQQSQARSVLIKKIIQQSQKQRLKPLFTDQQDRIFKQQLDKVFKNKQLVLNTNICESNIFLQTVQTEITDFMVAFRNQFANWQVQKQEEDINWPNLMKGYINKKLANSFGHKIPNWIKKMHSLFIDNQPAKPKVYFTSRMIQTVQYVSPRQIELKQENDELNSKLIIKRQALKQAQDHMQLERIKNQTHKKEIETLEKYYVEKVYEAKKYGRDKNPTSTLDLIKQKEQQAQQSLIYVNKTEQQLKKVHRKYKNNAPKVSVTSVNTYLQSKKVNNDVAATQNRINSEQNYNNEQNALKKSQSSKYSQEKDRQIQEQINENINQRNTLKKKTLIESSNKLKKKVYNRDNRQELLRQIKNNQKIEFSGLNKIKLQEVINLSENQLKEKVKNVNTQLANKKLITQALKPRKQQNSINLNKSYDFQENNLAKSRKSLNKENQLKKSNFSLIQQAETEQHKILRGNINNDHKPACFNQNQTILLTLPHLSQENQSKHVFQPNICKIVQYLKQMSNFSEMKNKKDKLTKIVHKLQSMLSEANCNAINQRALGRVKLETRSLHNQPELLKSNNSAIIYKDNGRQFNAYERKNRSLHVLKNPLKNEERLKLPQIERYHNQTVLESNNSNYISHFGHQIVTLFIDDRGACKYEESISQPATMNNTSKPTISQLQLIEQSFSVLQLISRKKKPIYTQICAFLRYPFSTIKNNFLSLDIVNELSFPTYCNYFFRILWIHRDCKIKEGYTFCSHVHAFMSKMKQIVDNNTITNKNGGS